MDHLAALLVLGFAAYRGTQLVVHDTIGDPVRSRIEMWHAAKFDSKVRTFVRDLLSCIYCVGFWLSVVAVLAWVSATGQWGDRSVWTFAVDAWAVAGIQSLISRVDDTLPVRA